MRISDWSSNVCSSDLPAHAISVLELVDAIEGRKPLFDCQDIRGRCALFEDGAPEWATRGVCSIHAVMLKAEKAMRDTLASETLADIGGRLERKAPAEFGGDTQAWFDARLARRRSRPSQAADRRAEERRGGKGWVSTCRTT